MGFTRLGSVLVAAYLLAGCAPALSTLQPATIAPKKSVHAAAGYGVSVPVAGTVRSVSQAKKAADRAQDGEEMSTKDQEEVIKTALGATLNPPSFGSEYQLGYGFADRWQADVRYALSAWRLGVRYQAIVPEPPGGRPLAASVGLGVSRYTFSFGVPKYLKPVADVEDFERWDVDVPVLFGVSHDVFHLWGGPKVIGSYVDARVEVCTRFDTTDRECAERAEAGLNGYAVYVAGQGGAAIGYKHAWLALELTTAVVNVDIGGRVAYQDTREKRRYNFYDVIVYPTLGLIIRY